MAPNLNPSFAYTVVYVNDVANSVANAFGYNVRHLDDSRGWGELESGQTTIAFTPKHQKETDKRSGEVQTPAGPEEKQPLEVCFAYDDVDEAYKTAVANGAVPVSPLEDKQWECTSGFAGPRRTRPWYPDGAPAGPPSAQLAVRNPPTSLSGADEPSGGRRTCRWYPGGAPAGPLNFSVSWTWSPPAVALSLAA